MMRDWIGLSSFRVAAAAAVLGLFPCTSPAQQATSVAITADSMALAGDTASAIALLERTVKRDFRDAGAWHELGLLYWNSAKSKRAALFMSDQRAIKLLRGADTALRIATQLAPDSARYWLTLTDFTGESGLSTVMYTSRGQAKHGIKAAEAAGETLLLARALHRLGMSSWRRYEADKNKAVNPFTEALGFKGDIRRLDLRDRFSEWHILQPPTGFTDYTEAFEAFHRALELDPSNQRYARGMYMALGDHGRWSELLILARQRTQSFPLDYQSQLARGLAAVRLGLGREARQAFDSALVLMDGIERTRLTSVARLLSPKRNPYQSNLVARDHAAYARLDSLQRLSYDALYWFMSDPLISTEENEVRDEFLARVAWADIRWTWEEMNIRGADTDFGDIHIRYGPPLKEFTVGGGIPIWIGWQYGGQVLFMFDLMPSFLTGYLQNKAAVLEYEDEIPVSFANLPETHLVSAVPVTTARFRANNDSMDVVVAASVPVDSLVKSLDMDPISIGLFMRLADGHTQTRARDSARFDVVAGKTDNAFQRSWTNRLPVTTHLLQVEALQADTRRVARSNVVMDPLPSSGFGMSDILLGTPPTQRRTVEPRSWRDVGATPVAGVFNDAQVGLVWEVYDLAQTGNQSRYGVEIQVERVQKGLRGFAARVVDEFGRTVGREQRSANRISFSFDRTAIPSPRVVDYFTLNMRDAGRGEYQLNVTITDRITGTKTSRRSKFVLR